MTPATNARALAPVDLASLPEYRPTAYTDFTQPAQREAYGKAPAAVKARSTRWSSAARG